MLSASAHSAFCQLILKEQRKGVEEAVGAVGGIIGAVIIGDMGGSKKDEINAV